MKNYNPIISNDPNTDQLMSDSNSDNKKQSKCISCLECCCNCFTSLMDSCCCFSAGLWLIMIGSSK